MDNENIRDPPPPARGYGDTEATAERLADAMSERLKKENVEHDHVINES